MQEKQMNDSPWYRCQLIILMICCFFITTITAVAQASPVTVELGRSTMTTDDQLRVGIVIEGRIDDLPNPPEFEGFNFLGRTQSSQTTVINGNVQSLITIIYTLQPVVTGTLTIGSFETIVDGVKISSNPQTVTVTEGKQFSPSKSDANIPAALTGAESVYAEAMVDKEKPWLGEQIVYTFRFYRATDRLMNANYEPPEFIGFWHGDEEERNSYLVLVNGREYQVTEFHRYIFPTIAGELIIEPTIFIINDTIEIKTEAVAVGVRALPNPQPVNFSGAVGNYAIEATVDKTETMVDDPITVSIQLSGEGNIDIMPDPDFVVLPEWRSIEQNSVVNAQFENGVLKGERQWEQLLIPSLPGEWTIPEIDYVYFDPQKSSYETTSSGAYVVNVGGESVDVDTPMVESIPLSNAVVQETLHPLLPPPLMLKKIATPLTDQSLFWALWLLPLLAIIGDRGVQAANQFVERPSKKKRPNQVMTAIVQSAHPSHDVDRWLEKQYGVQLHGLTHAERMDVLQTTELSEVALAKIDAFYHTAEAARYSGDRSTIVHVDALIKTIEAEQSL